MVRNTNKTLKDPNTGIEEGSVEAEDCGHCDGSGDNPNRRKDQYGEPLPCPECGGSGKSKD